MRLYPAAPRPLRATLAVDVLVLALLVVLALLALEVRDAVAELAEIGEGVESAGTSIKAALDTAAGGVESLPLVGGELADQLRRAGEGTGDQAVAAGREGQERVHELARTLGWVTFLVPALLILAQYVPYRVRRVQHFAAAPRAAATAHPAQLAARAAYSLPYAQLARHTKDPLGDLDRGHHAPLVAAALEDAGLAPIPER